MTRPVDGYTLELAAKVCAENAERWKRLRGTYAIASDNLAAMCRWHEALECERRIRAIAPPSSSPAVPQERRKGIASRSFWDRTERRAAVPQEGTPDDVDYWRERFRAMAAACSQETERAEQAESALLASEAARRGVEQALAELVRLKDLKEAYDADQEREIGDLVLRDGLDWFVKQGEMLREYQSKKPLAWESARAALSQSQAPTGGTE